MNELKRTFGRLLAVHRRRKRLTQQQLAENAGLSVDTIAKLESGTTGASFTTIEALAQALQVEPAEFFTALPQGGGTANGTLLEITMRLAALPEAELLWLRKLIDAALRPR